jgi:hypothetical protein
MSQRCCPFCLETSLRLIQPNTRRRCVEVKYDIHAPLFSGAVHRNFGSENQKAPLPLYCVSRCRISSQPHGFRQSRSGACPLSRAPSARNNSFFHDGSPLSSFRRKPKSPMIQKRLNSSDPRLPPGHADGDPSASFGRRAFGLKNEFPTRSDMRERVSLGRVLTLITGTVRQFPCGPPTGTGSFFDLGAKKGAADSISDDSSRRCSPRTGASQRLGFA